MQPIHPTYLPYTSEQLARHFIGAGTGTRPGRHTEYFEKSAARAKEKDLAKSTGRSMSAAQRSTLETYGFQMEKDERFWVATALMGLFHSPDPVVAFADLLARGLPSGRPTGTTWEELLGNRADLELYFEVHLPAPVAYSDGLKDRVDDAVFQPYLREKARSRPGMRLEGTTKADAVLLNRATGFAVVFEAKVLSDISTHTRFDATRNQLARIVDVALERNKELPSPLKECLPEKTFVFLLTPERFRRRPETRLYGLLLERYQQEPALLQEHLAHRKPEELMGVHERLGWLTWEDCVRVVPTSCPWLRSEQ